MTRQADVDRLLESWLAEGPTELPNRAVDNILMQLDENEQRRRWLPGREQMNRMIFAIGGVAAVVIVVAAAAFYFGNPNGLGPGVGGQPSPTPSPRPTVAISPSVEPTAPPSPSATLRSDPQGVLPPGTRVLAHPFAPPNNGIGFTFTVPSNSWEALHGDSVGTIGIARFGDFGGLGMGFMRVASLNGDPCNHSGTADDIAIGPTVDDLVGALTSTSVDLVPDLKYDVSASTDVSLGGYSGKQLIVTMPNRQGSRETWASDCDGQAFVIWNEYTEEGFYVNAHGPENRWTLLVLDVEGERVVILTSDFASSPPNLVQELQSIVASIEISAP